MCGRFTLHHGTEELTERFAVEQALLDLKPRYNIAPTQPVAAVIQRESRVLVELQWGLVPSWARDPAVGHRMINARAESAAARPAFRNAFARGRCLIPASGWFEWKRRGRQRIPMLLRRRGGEPLALAGLYERWKRSDDAVLRTCAILTTEPEEVAATVHDRMPAVLTPEACEVWLDREIEDAESLARLLRPYPLGDLVAHPVSPRVNRPDEDDPSLIEEVEPPPPEDHGQLDLGL